MADENPDERFNEKVSSCSHKKREAPPVSCFNGTNDIIGISNISKRKTRGFSEKKTQVAAKKNPCELKERPLVSLCHCLIENNNNRHDYASGWKLRSECIRTFLIGSNCLKLLNEPSLRCRCAESCSLDKDPSPLCFAVNHGCLCANGRLHHCSNLKGWHFSGIGIQRTDEISSYSAISRPI